jgi:hypothetical protein
MTLVAFGDAIAAESHHDDDPGDGALRTRPVRVTLERPASDATFSGLYTLADAAAFQQGSIWGRSRTRCTSITFC